jgi:hypothetical protein
VRTPLHPEAFRYQVRNDNELYNEIHSEQGNRKGIWKLLDYAWCSAVCATTLNVVTEHGSIWIPAGLMTGRLLIAVALTFWALWSHRNVGN